MRYDSLFLRVWRLLPNYLQPRFIRIVDAKYWFDWLTVKEMDSERRYKYTKATVE